MKKTLLTLLIVSTSAIYSQNEEPFDLRKGETGILIPETEEFYGGSRLSVEETENGLTAVLANASRRTFSDEVRETISEKQVNLCDALNHFTFFTFTCYMGEINNVQPLGGAIQIQCLPSTKICFVGVASPI